MAQSSEIKLNKRFDQNIEVTGKLSVVDTDPTLFLSYSGAVNNAASGKILFAEAPTYTSGHFEIKYDGSTNILSFNSPIDGTTDLFSVNRNGTVKIGSNTVVHSGNISSYALTSFDITSQTDPKYLRSNADDTTSGNITISKQSAIINMGYQGGPHGINFYDDGAGNNDLRWGFYYRTSPDTITFETGGNSPKFTLDTSGNLTVTGTLSASGYNKSNWDTAYGWGNHADEGYLTSITNVREDNGGELPNTTDLNTLIDNGLYGQNSNAQALSTNNYPSGGGFAGILEVLNDPGNNYHTSQMYFKYNGDNDIFHRYRYDTSGGTATWSDWAKIWTSRTDGSGSGLDADLLDGLEASQFIRSDANNTSSGNLTISKNAPSIYLYDPNTSNTNYPELRFNTANNQGVKFVHNEFDGDLPIAGYGLILTGDDANTQFGTTGVLSFTVHGNIYAGGTTNSTVSRVLTTADEGSGNGLDADTLDGVHASSFLRSDIADTITASLTFSNAYIKNTNAVLFNNSENSGTYYTDESGVLAFDENFYGDANYGTGSYNPSAVWSNNGGGLVIKNEDGWGGVFTSTNSRWATPTWEGLIVDNGIAIGTTSRSDGDLNINDPLLHVYGPQTSSAYHLTARFQAGNDANDTGAAIAINHSNDRGLLIKAGRKDSDRPVAYFDLIDSNGSTTNLLTLGEYGSSFRAGINTTSPDTTFHVNGGAKIGGSLQGTELLIEASDTAGAPASTATIKMIGYEGRGIGTFYKDVTYGSAEWFAGIRYSGSFQNYQIGYTATGGQAEYATNAIMTVNHTGQVGIGTNSPTSGYKLDVVGLGKFDNAVSVDAVDTGNPTPAANEARLSGYGIIGNRGTFYVTNPGGTVQIGNGANHNNNPTAYFTSTSISLLRPTAVTGNLVASGNISASSTSYVQLEADQTDSAAVRLGVSSGSLEGFVMTNNEGASHLSGNTSIKMLVYSTGGAMIEPARFTTDGIVANGSDPAQNAEITCYGNMSFGHPGNGTNVNGRFISIEGNTASDGEGSGRLFFAEHNSTTTSMDAYGMSIGYRGGGTTITGASGNAWTGLSQIGNGQWGMWGHDNNATGALIMYGDRAGTFVNFAGNNIQGVDQIVLANAIVHDNDTDTYLQFNSNDSFRVVIAGSEVSRWGNNYLRMNDGDTFRMGTGSDFRQWHNGTDHYFRNYHHAGGNIYFQTEGTGGVNHALIYMYGNTDRPYVVLYEDSVERLRTVSDGIDVTGIMTATADVVAYSDERVKENVKTIDNALDKVKALRGVSYNRTDLEDKSPKIGVIAQEVQKVLPEVVYEQSNEMLAVSYGNMVSVLIEAVKELSNKVEELENKLNGTEL